MYTILVKDIITLKKYAEIHDSSLPIPRVKETLALEFLSGTNVFIVRDVLYSYPIGRDPVIVLISVEPK